RPQGRGHMSRLLEVEGLTIGFPTAEGGCAFAARDVSFALDRGETLGIVGESGCGKSVSLRALLGIVPPPGRPVAGSIRWRGDRDLLSAAPAELRELRGKEIAMIFQDPQSSLSPVYTIGDQLTEVLRKRLGLSRKPATAR